MIKSTDKLNPALIDVPSPEIAKTPGGSGYPDAMAALDTPDALRQCCGETAREFPQALWVEPNRWLEKAKENDANHTWGLNYIDRYSNQAPTHECTSHGLRVGFEAARNRQRGIIFPEGPKKGYRYPESAEGSVWVSCLSVYAEANPGQWGGAGCIQVLNIACKRGFLPDKIQPKEYGFKHSLQGTAGGGGMNQSSGQFVKVSGFPSGWEATAKLLMPLEVIVVTDPEQAVSLLLNGLVINYGRSGHAVAQAILKMAGGGGVEATGYPDSYDVTRWDSWRTFQGAVRGGAYCIVSVTTPDSWDRPGE